MYQSKDDNILVPQNSFNFFQPRSTTTSSTTTTTATTTTATTVAAAAATTTNNNSKDNICKWEAKNCGINLDLDPNKSKTRK